MLCGKNMFKNKKAYRERPRKWKGTVMGGFFGVASKEDCVFDLFFGTDYHSHLGTRRAGMAVYSEEHGFEKAIHKIDNAPFGQSLIKKQIP